MKKDYKKGDHVYLIDHYKELDEDIKTDTIYWIVEKHYHTNNFKIDYTLKDTQSNNVVWLSHKIAHVIRRLDKKWVRKLKMKKINDRKTV